MTRESELLSGGSQGNGFWGGKDGGWNCSCGGGNGIPGIGGGWNDPGWNPGGSPSGSGGDGAGGGGSGNALYAAGGDGTDGEDGGIVTHQPQRSPRLSESAGLSVFGGKIDPPSDPNSPQYKDLLARVAKANEDMRKKQAEGTLDALDVVGALFNRLADGVEGTMEMIGDAIILDGRLPYLYNWLAYGEENAAWMTQQMQKDVIDKYKNGLSQFWSDFTYGLKTILDGKAWDAVKGDFEKDPSGFVGRTLADGIMFWQTWKQFTKPKSVPKGTESTKPPGSATEPPATKPAQKGPLSEGELGRYGDQKKQKPEAGTQLDRDHIPSQGALKKRAEELKGRPLTPEEEAEIRKGGNSVAIDPETHKKGRTYGGKNTEKQRRADGADLSKAAENDIKKYKSLMTDSQYEVYRNAFDKILEYTNEWYDKWLRSIVNGDE